MDEKMQAAADAMHAELLKQVEGLMDAEGGQRGADLDRLAGIVSAYEEQRWPISPPIPTTEADDIAFLRRLERWVARQHMLEGKVADAAAYFKVSTERIEQVAEDHPWMGVTRRDDGDVIFLDGE